MPLETKLARHMQPYSWSSRFTIHCQGNYFQLHCLLCVKLLMFPSIGQEDIWNYLQLDNISNFSCCAIPIRFLCIIQAYKSVDFYLSFYFLARPAIRKNYIKNMKVTISLPYFRYLLQEHREASVDIKVQLNRYC